MTLKYESELLFDLMKRDGDDAPSDVLPYESELKEKYLNQVVGAYPKLQDYQPEWLNYNLYHRIPSEFPIESVANVTSASFHNVVPYAYKSAILKGSTKYRDIDTGEILESFEEGRNLELVSVKMPVLTTTGKNLCDINKYIHVGISNTNMVFSKNQYRSYYMKCKPSTVYTVKVENSNNRFGVASSHLFSENSGFKLNNNYLNGTANLTGQTLQHTFTTTEKDKYLYVYVANNGIFNPNIRVQVEESPTATTYEPHKSNILTVNEPIELHGIGEVKDELNLLTGELTQKFGEVVLDGSENWTFNKSYLYAELALNDYSGLAENISVNNRLPQISIYGNENSLNNHRYGLMIGKNNIIRLRMADEQSGQTLEGIKQYLSQNPVTIKYHLATESVKTVDLTVTDQDGITESIIRPIEGTMHVNTSSQTLPPLLDMGVPVEATTQNLMSFANIVEEEE